ncbi:DUF2243 domain-containing protein [Cupriavidus gilardii]|uniref:DUF2243 domain-containing protein n=1 Tax=Cupriavidus gilardii TaxID=82541 RepID=A0ABY4VT35_9BURK|nr:DUF2243 domain-containing protein [Cupriavidus gilardii]USE80186.1 DUF2243 domain-containing protein [Cupriavidus gilardii]
MPTDRASPVAGPVHPRAFAWAGYTLGFAMSGFFDGILLHQILQWHHLLSGIERGALGDLRVQVMADGVFHALMYVIAAIGLWLLYRNREAFSIPHAPRRLLADFWIGFGVWHVVDAVLSHWITGIHRIRMDSPNPLLGDLIWLFLFGLIPLIVGFRMRKTSTGAGPHAGAGPRGPGIAANWVAAMLVGGSLLGASLNLFPVRAAPIDTTTVVMRPGAPPSQLFTALEGSDARIVWTDAGGGVWVLSGAEAVDRLRLYRHGAMYASGTAAPAGCSAWVR